MISEMSVYDPRYSDELLLLSEEERADWQEEELKLKNGFDYLIALQYCNSVDIRFLEGIESAIETLQALNRFSDDLKFRKCINIQDVQSDLEKQEIGSKEYWDTYGHLEFLIRNTNTIPKELVNDVGKLYITVQQAKLQVARLEVFDELKYPQSYAAVYKFNGQSKLNGWIQKAVASDASIKAQLYTYNCFSSVLCSTSLKDCFFRWIIDSEIVNYLGDYQNNVISELYDLYEYYSNDNLYLKYMDIASVDLFNCMLQGKPIQDKLKKSREILNGTSYALDFEKVFIEMSRRCGHLVSC